jgi:hypothetical protein
MSGGRGEPCFRCGLKPGAHTWDNGGPHPKACREWTTEAWLAEDRARQFENEVHDADMEARG